MRITLVTGVLPNEQPGDLEAGEGAHVTIAICQLEEKEEDKRFTVKTTVIVLHNHVYDNLHVFPTSSVQS